MISKPKWDEPIGIFLCLLIIKTNNNINFIIFVCISCAPFSNFTSFYDKTYGNCFTFNSGFNDTEVLRTAKPGSVYGRHQEQLFLQINKPVH